jgi:hypothetical protein
LLKKRKLVISVAFCLPALAGVGPIGMATSPGDIEVGQVRMPGPATLYEGAVVETGNSPAQVSLRSGAIIRLSGGARATIHANSLLLERGVGQVDAPSDYVIHARSVTFVPSSQPARARLQVTGDGTLQMAALSGSFDVHRIGLASIGTVAAGTSLKFAVDTGEAGASAPSQFKGCLAKSEKGYLLQQEGSQAVLALTGNSISAKAGDRVTVVGKTDTAAAPVAGTTEVVQVLRLTVDGHGCSAKSVLAAANAAGAGSAGTGATPSAGAGAATGAAAGGMSATTIAVIGVAVAGAALIPTIALTSGSSSSSNISSSSR